MLNSFYLPLQFYSPSCILFCDLKGFWLSCPIDNTIRRLVESKRVRSSYIIPLLSPSRMTMGWLYFLLYFFQSVLTTELLKAVVTSLRVLHCPLGCTLALSFIKHSLNHPIVCTIFFFCFDSDAHRNHSFNWVLKILCFISQYLLPLNVMIKLLLPGKLLITQST